MLHTNAGLYFNNIRLIILLGLLCLLSSEQFLDMLLASLLTLFTFYQRNESFDSFFDLIMSHVRNFTESLTC